MRLDRTIDDDQSYSDCRVSSTCLFFLNLPQCINISTLRLICLSAWEAPSLYMQLTKGERLLKKYNLEVSDVILAEKHAPM